MSSGLKKGGTDWQQHLLSRGMVRRSRERDLCASEIMTILVAFHQIGYRHFKGFYSENPHSRRCGD